jgi:hypothetical protein
MMACEKKQQMLNEAEIISSLKTCLNDRRFKENVIGDSPVPIKNWELYSTNKINSSFRVDDRFYTFKDSTLFIPNEHSIYYRISYVEKNTAQIKLSYQPSKSYEIFGEFDFSYIDRKWVSTKSRSGTIDKKSD